MIIRKAEQYDYDGINSLITEFFNESLSDFIYELDIDSIRTSFEVMVEKYIVLVAIKDDAVVGVIAGTLAPADLNHNLIIATEIMWFVNKEHRDSTVGVKLFRAFEKYTEEQGATHIAMAFMENLHPDRIKKFYESKGYKPMQTQYIRSVK